MASIFSDSWINLVFQDRNQAYGAYELRKNSSKNSYTAGIISVTVFSLIVAAPFIYNFITGQFGKDKVVKVDQTSELMAPPPIDPTTPPPPPVEPPPPLKTTIKFTPPVIVKDEEVKDEDAPPPQDEFKDKDAAAKSVQGDSLNGRDAGLDTKGNDVIDDKPVEQIFQVVEQMPDFPGGQAALMKYLGSNTVYPPIAKENDIEGTVYVQFVVDKTGAVTNVKVARPVDKYLDKEALRVVSSMPKWKPGKQNGKEVSVYYTVPIRFKLQ